jgi:hypothetical protein
MPSAPSGHGTQCLHSSSSFKLRTDTELRASVELDGRTSWSPMRRFKQHACCCAPPSAERRMRRPQDRPERSVCLGYDGLSSAAHQASKIQSDSGRHSHPAPHTACVPPGAQEVPAHLGHHTSCLLLAPSRRGPSHPARTPVEKHSPMPVALPPWTSNEGATRRQCAYAAPLRADWRGRARQRSRTQQAALDVRCYSQ